MKLSLRIESGSLAGRQIELTNGTLTFGRGETCSLVFDSSVDSMVSTRHAHIENQGNGYTLIDDRSTNGTFVNGQRVQVHQLNSGDSIQFGKNGPTATVQIQNPVPVASATPTLAYQAEIPPTQHVPSAQAQQYFYENSPPAFPPAQGGQPFAPQLPPQDFKKSISFIGLGNPDIKPPESNTGKYIGAAIAIFAVVFLSLIVVGIMLLSLHPVAAVIASVVAFTPAFFYILPFIWLDRYDPEPPWLLALAFAWGALVAVIFSFVVNTVIGSIFGQEVGAVISAPIFEEGSKGLGLLILLIFARREFDDILDGIVYAGLIALGFATVENVLYYGRGLMQGGTDGLMVLFIVRGIMSPFAHVTFTAMTGIGCGIARESHNMFVRLIMPVLGYFGAVTLHAIWNGVATFFGIEGFLLAYIVLQVPFFFIFAGFSLYIMWRQNKILREMLSLDVAKGLITEEQYNTATSAFKSTGWLLGGIFSGKFGARRKFLRNVGKLGLSYWHIQRATAAQGETGSFQQNPILREAVLKWRDKV